jgi:hypothetical protein
MITFTIRGRNYAVSQTTPTGDILIFGRCRTAAGALMPNLLDSLYVSFEAAHIPAGGLIDDGQADSLRFRFHPGKAQMIAYKAFKEIAEATPIIQDLRRRANVIMRRFRLAKLAHLDLSRQRQYRLPLEAIKAEMGTVLDALFGEFEHPLKSILAEDGGVWKSWLTEMHDPYDVRRRIILEAGDREWLEMQIAGIRVRLAEDYIYRGEEEW